MKAVVSPLGLPQGFTDAERAAAPVEESAAVDANGQKSAGFDAVLALVAAQVATISPKGVAPEAPAQALLQQPQLPTPPQGNAAATTTPKSGTHSSDVVSTLQSELLAAGTGSTVGGKEWLVQSRSLQANVARGAAVSAPTKPSVVAISAQNAPETALQASAQAVLESGTHPAATPAEQPAKAAKMTPQPGRQSIDVPAVMEPAQSAQTDVTLPTPDPKIGAQPQPAKAAEKPAQSTAQVGEQVQTPAAPAVSQPTAALPLDAAQGSRQGAQKLAKDASVRADAGAQQPPSEREEPARTSAQEGNAANMQQPDARLLMQAQSAVQTPVAHKVTQAAPTVQAHDARAPQAVAQQLQSDVSTVQTQPFDIETPPFALPFEDAAQADLSLPALSGEQLQPKVAAQAALSDVQLVQGLVETSGTAGLAKASPAQSSGVRAESKLQAQELADANVRVELVDVAAAEGEAGKEAAREPNAGESRNEPSVDREAREASERDAASQQDSEPRQGFQQQTRDNGFAASEVQGARGLDAVVASLLRASGGEERAPTNPVGNHAAMTREPVRVETAKSAEVKSSDAASTMRQQLVQSEAARLQEEEARKERDVNAPDFMMHARPEPMRMQDAQSSEPVLPVVAPAPVPVDPDAAAMGNLARGEGVQAANITIDHPELGAMDLMVQHENGRVDVRATMQTPRAAAVLRAHESSLRYGIQQAGMTFGALRVRARSGDGQTVKARDTGKRRREA